MADIVSLTELNPTFPRFGDLPCEPRLQIWKYAMCNVQRTITLEDDWPHGRVTHIPWSPLPSVAAPCSEARHVAHRTPGVTYDYKGRKNNTAKLRCLLLPLDILYFRRPVWPARYFKTEGISKNVRKFRTISVRWNLPAIGPRKGIPECRFTQRGLILEAWAFLTDVKLMDTLMVDFQPGTEDCFTNFRSVPSSNRKIHIRTGSFTFPEYLGTSHRQGPRLLRTVDIFDKIVDRVASTTGMLRVDPSRSSMFSEECDIIIRGVLQQRGRWLEIEANIKRLWIDICKYRVLKTTKDTWRLDYDALRLAMSPDHDPDWTRKILQKAPTFKPVFTFDPLAVAALEEELGFFVDFGEVNSPIKSAMGAGSRFLTCVGGTAMMEIGNVDDDV